MCNCNENKDLDTIRNLATIYSRGTQQNVQIYKNINGYNFEPINSNRGNIIEIIKWVKE